MRALLFVFVVVFTLSAFGQSRKYPNNAKQIETASAEQIVLVGDRQLPGDKFIGFSPDGELAYTTQWHPDGSADGDRWPSSLYISKVAEESPPIEVNLGPVGLPIAGAASPDGKKILIYSYNKWTHFDLETKKATVLPLGIEGSTTILFRWTEPMRVDIIHYSFPQNTFGADPLTPLIYQTGGIRSLDLNTLQIGSVTCPPKLEG